MYSYKIEHDYGLAPNPFGGYCTLAICKPTIRGNRRLKIGDWVIGTGSAKLKNLNHLIFAMKVEEKLDFNQYWNDDRFQYKKPIINGSLAKMYGDNIYHQDANGDWIQKNSAHSLIDGTPNEGHIKTDTGGNYVLISQTFYYFGSNQISIPEEYREVCNKGRNMKGPSIPDEVASEFIDWLQSNFRYGIHGDPINWKEHLK